MRIIDRYILGSIVPAFLLCIFIFMFLYVVVDIFSHLDEILKHKVTILALKEYYLNFLPLIFVQTSPMACILATVWILGGLNRNNEIIAIRSAGLSVWKIVKSILFFGMIISLAVFIINENLVPVTQSKISQIKLEKFQGKKETKQINNLAVYGLDNRLFFIKNFSPQKNKLEGIIILEQDRDQNLLSKIVAASGRWKENHWVFNKCIIYRFNRLGQLDAQPKYFEQTLMGFPETPNDFLRQSHDITFMNMAQLKDYILRLSKGGAEAAVRNFKVDFQNRISFPFTSLIIIFIGIPFSLYGRTRVTILSSIGVCIAITFLYFVANAVSLALGKSGMISPVLSAWSAHIIFILAGLFLINRLP